MRRVAELGGLSLIALVACFCWAQTAAQSDFDSRITGGTGNFMYSSQPTSQMMPSEARNAYWQSGLLPSEVRGNYACLGPMTTQGQSAYFDKPGGSSSTAKNTSSDMLVRPNVSSAPSRGYSSPGAGSVRYSSAVAPKTSPTASQQVGSVRYDSRVR
jgi:hypothetical protein